MIDTRVLKLNGNIVHLDAETAIGITMQAYDVAQPAKNKVAVSNAFTLPCTAHNLATIGFPNSGQGLKNELYEPLEVEYWTGGERYIKGALARVDEVGERISLFIYQRPSVWDELKAMSWPTFAGLYCDWLLENEYIINFDNRVNSFDTLINSIVSGNDHIVLPYFLSNLTKYSFPSVGVVEELGNIWLVKREGGKPDRLGVHISAYPKSVFEFISEHFGYNFMTASTVSGMPEIWQDAVANSIYIPMPSVAPFTEYDGVNPPKFLFAKKDIGDVSTEAAPHGKLKDRGGKTVYDFVIAFFQHLNALVDPKSDASTAILRFDDIVNAPIVNFEDGLTGTPSIKPYIEGQAQQWDIRFKSVDDQQDATANQKRITCDNKNIPKQGVLFEIDAHVPNVVLDGVVSILDLSSKGAIENFTFLVSNGTTSGTIRVNTDDGFPVYTDVNLQIAALYSLDSEYQTYQALAQRPEVWTIQKWVPPVKLGQFNFAQLYALPSLGGSFFVTAIEGYNPDKSNEPTTFKLVKVTNKVDGGLQKDSIYWTDGRGNIFTDGFGNKFY